jgi:hypothetical protein
MSHLVIMQNGLHGWSSSFAKIKSMFLDKFDSEYDVVISNVNDFRLSRQGTKCCGNRLAQFVQNIISKSPTTYKKISFVSHSFGGIIVRYAIGVLYTQKVFDIIQPILYVSIASPHVGVTTSNKFIKLCASHMCGQTGKELMLLDSNKILETLSDPTKCFVIALALFKKRIAYGNASKDFQVPFETACIYPFKVFKQSNSTSIYKEIGELYISNNEHELEKIEKIDQISEDVYKIYKNLFTLNITRKYIDLNDYLISHNEI